MYWVNGVLAGRFCAFWQLPKFWQGYLWPLRILYCPTLIILTNPLILVNLGLDQAVKLDRMNQPANP
ncbi:MAG: hypothetical protein B0A82_22895 [Alkalinema sp. CACIAM 70d]|nr:MAG: hypothetical protein B0A82_22895 [Alkalinema sp. CACIAM 70d]